MEELLLPATECNVGQMETAETVTEPRILEVETPVEKA
jgi:hypothetical protein